LKIHELEHILRAAGAITQEEVLVVIGSQSILGALPDAPEELLRSIEADVYPFKAPEKADLIDGSIGERSPFHDTFGYYAHGVGPETAYLPSRWLSRTIEINNSNTRGVTGLCLHPVDLAIRKLLAGRPKDLDFVRILFAEEIITLDLLQEVSIELTADQRALVEERVPQILRPKG
jgi:hypothetical protein